MGYCSGLKTVCLNDDGVVSSRSFFFSSTITVSSTNLSSYASVVLTFFCCLNRLRYSIGLPAPSSVVLCCAALRWGSMFGSDRLFCRSCSYWVDLEGSCWLAMHSFFWKWRALLGRSSLGDFWPSNESEQVLLSLSYWEKVPDLVAWELKVQEPEESLLSLCSLVFLLSIFSARANSSVKALDVVVVESDCCLRNNSLKSFSLSLISYLIVDSLSRSALASSCLDRSVSLIAASSLSFCRSSFSFAFKKASFCSR